MTIAFSDAFHSLTGRSPFRWQQRLFDEIVGGSRHDACDIPTGLGKTSIIPIWLIALAVQAERNAVTLPRRLVYVVDRRTVVDQATDDAEQIRKRLGEAAAGSAATEIAEALERLCVASDGSPLAISTLRGEFADNREWQADPARAAIIVGTVDMIGSRLLFQGYGAGRSSRRALSAGLLGHDALLVHDEAHLSRPFGKLVRKVAEVQTGEGVSLPDRHKRPLRLLEMTATPGDTRSEPFKLSPEERDEAVVRQRLLAKKALKITEVTVDALEAKLIEAALGHSESGVRVLVYVRTPDLAKKIADELRETLHKTEPKTGVNRVALLTGTLRGFERDELAKSKLFAAFKADPKREALQQTIYLVATSAGEVGVDLDADHMVCDLTTLDSMIQRLGRVNRLGRENESFVARVDVFHAAAAKAKDEDAVHAGKLEEARKITAEIFSKRPLGEGGRSDASPQALRSLVDGLDSEKRIAAFAPEPDSLTATDILFDNWALTSVRDLPGRPPVHDWLHGKESQPPETTVAWREEVDEIADALSDGRMSGEDALEWFDAHEIEPQERLRETPARAAKAFDAIAKRAERGGRPVAAILLDQEKQAASALSIKQLADKALLVNATVVLPLYAGGLPRDGLLDGSSPQATDVADVPRRPKSTDGSETDEHRWRARLTKHDGIWSVAVVGDPDRRIIPGLERFNREQADERSIDKVVTRLLKFVKAASKLSFAEKARVLLVPEDEPDAAFHALVSFTPAESAATAFDRSEAAPAKQKLKLHLAEAECYAKLIARKLALGPETAEALRIAARYHDLGKDRRPWQRAIGNTSYPQEVLAKSDHRRFDSSLCKNYRHEFGSLIEARRLAEIKALPDWQRELVLHLIASHHGRARPNFKADLDDPNADADEIAVALVETPQFLARMQRRFGRWGLAWLETLMKAADVMATTSIEPEDEPAVSANGAAAAPETRA